MGRVKQMLIEQEEKLYDYVWDIVSECETFDEFRKKVWEYINDNNLLHMHSDLVLLSDVWNEHWSKYNMEGK